MGINTAFANLLVRARQDGAVFDSIATVGRQSLTVPIADVKAMASRLGLSGIDWSAFAADGYAEDFFVHVLGANRVTSFDNSAYQQASIVHDFNTPVSPHLHEAFDAVIDGGSLEHIFDIKQALSNYINLTKHNGRVFVNTPSNNLSGHGFYQFSPEFFYRVFDEGNGFVVENVTLIETPLKFVEASRHQRCYLTADPAKLGQRVLLINSKPVMIYVQARRIAVQPPFLHPPLQSDHAFKWAPQAGDGHPSRRAKKRKEGGDQDSRKPFSYVSTWQLLRRRWQQHRKNSLSNRRWFTPFVP